MKNVQASFEFNQWESLEKQMRNIIDDKAVFKTNWSLTFQKCKPVAEVTLQVVHCRFVLIIVQLNKAQNHIITNKGKVLSETTTYEDIIAPQTSDSI